MYTKFLVTVEDLKRMKASFSTEKSSEKSLLTKSLRERKEREQMMADFKVHPELELFKT